MIVAQTISECREARAKLGTVALVPTMGALHAGHASLFETAKNHAQHLGVSIFVNPTQFGPREDFARYPRPIEKDLEICEAAGADLVFNPTVEEMYPNRPAGAGALTFRTEDKAGAVAPESPPPEIVLDIAQLSSVLEGRFRPGHFRGVCQIVAKLFNIVQPQAACFGQKDYQQLCIVKRMTQGLDWPIDIIACPTVRDPDGLALSSRNQYLTPEQRIRALSISRGLMAAEKEFKSGVPHANRLVTLVQNTMLDTPAQSNVSMLIDYVAAVDADSLKTVMKITTPTVLTVAARVGQTRLVDNIILTPE